MFRIKICGITNVEDAIATVDAGADAIGLNFYEMSPRFLEIPTGREIRKHIASRAAAIGVFVNASPTVINSTTRLALLSGVQLHGDESPDAVAGISEALQAAEFLSESTLDLRLVVARRIDQHGTRPIEIELRRYASLGCIPHAVLIDAATPGHYGGTGKTANWDNLAMYRSWLGDTPLILAGGLTPDNVAEAIRIVRPHGVDVASGVESAPGKKDPHKVRDFIAAARAALDALPTSNQ